MKRCILCVLVCVLLLQACGKVQQTNESTDMTTFGPSEIVMIASEVLSTSVTETDPVSETSQLELSATVSAPQERESTTVRPAASDAYDISTAAAKANTTRSYQLKSPKRVSQTTKQHAEPVSSSTTTTTAVSETSTTVPVFVGGSVSGISSVSPSLPGTTKDSLPVCTLTISCKEICQHPDLLKKEEKLAFVPEDGYILKDLEMTFSQGETVYDVLRRACDSHTCKANCAFCSRDGKIQMESSYTPVYSSYYVEGIHQLYEKDCGGTSGWTYYVNGVFPHYGSSQYVLHNGDRIEWVYSIEQDSLE